MRAALIALSVLLALPLSAHGQFKRYFDVGTLRIAALKEPEWGVRVEANRVRYLCLSGCASPTAIEFKGVVRGEKLPEAFESGALAPAVLRQQGEATASRLGSTFLGAAPLVVAGQKGVQMEASADLNGAVYFVTRWIGQEDRMLDVKVTARDVDLARRLADTATQSLVPQVFGQSSDRATSKP
jgi:hypothetical protein